MAYNGSPAHRVETERGSLSHDNFGFIFLQKKQNPHETICKLLLSGNLFLADPKRVRKLDVNPADAMKFAVSAGVTNIQLEPKTGNIQTI